MSTCAVDGCTRGRRCRGWCDAHYYRWRKHGDPLGGGCTRQPRGRSCAIDGCGRPVRARGWCPVHYTRWLKHGDPLGVALRCRPIDERFWAKVDKDGPVPPGRPELGPCWLWTGARLPSGYGSLGRHGNAHRMALRLVGRLVPDDMEADHLCYVTSCVNPAHLEIVTPEENRRRATERRARLKEAAAA
ncbi:MAG: HNH endonuclease [Acidimicrobiales bacterium]